MTNGATVIYNKYVRPLHRKHINKIEDFAEMIENLINSSGSASAPITPDKSGKKLV